MRGLRLNKNDLMHAGCSKNNLFTPFILFLGLLLASCSPPSSRKHVSSSGSPSKSYAAYATRDTVEEDLTRYRQRPVGGPVGDSPWIAHVRAVDLDADGLMDFLACEAKHNLVLWIRQVSPGQFEEQIIGEEMRAPVHVEATDMDGDGDLDVIVSSMSVVFPNNDKIGAIFILEQRGGAEFETHLIIEGIDRVVDAKAVDFNGDGQLDLAVGQFGYDQGEVRWMRRAGPWTFHNDVLLSMSGTVNVEVADFDGNGTQDMVALVSQQWEEIHLFLNVGRGNYQRKLIWGSTNEDFSLSGMRLADMNKDGRMDILFTNGDGFGPNPEPGPKPWHGVQFLENKGGGRFAYHRVGDLGGAYSPVGTDLDLDGDMDVVALGAFSDWTGNEPEALVWFRNEGGTTFKKCILSRGPPYMITLDVADFDGPGGYPWIVTGGFHAFPPWEPQSRLLLWEPTRKP